MAKKQWSTDSEYMEWARREANKVRIEPNIPYEKPQKEIEMGNGRAYDPYNGEHNQDD